jgi:hypothetical protein
MCIVSQTIYVVIGWAGEGYLGSGSSQSTPAVKTGTPPSRNQCIPRSEPTRCGVRQFPPDVRCPVRYPAWSNGGSGSITAVCSSSHETGRRIRERRREKLTRRPAKSDTERDTGVRDRTKIVTDNSSRCPSLSDVNALAPSRGFERTRPIRSARELRLWRPDERRLT